MVEDILCSANFFDITPAELATGTYKLPRLAHYDGPLETNAIAEWFIGTIVMTPYMVHAHFRPFLRRVFDTTEGAPRQTFSLANLLPFEALSPPTDDTVADFPADRKWNPHSDPKGLSFLSMASHTNVPAEPPDMDMADSEAVPANTPQAAPQSAS